MVRVVIFVIAILGIFAGTLVYGGERLGAWDQAEPPPPSNLQPIARPQEKKEKKDDESAPPSAPTQVSPDDAFATIRPAKGDERQVAKLLALFDRDERLVAAVLTAVREGNAGALLELNDRLTSVAGQEADILVGLGATDCSLGLVGTAY
jgi:hypothetical protein